MVAETGVLVAGLGPAGSAVARALFASPVGNAPCMLLDKEQGEMLVDVILSEAGGVAGALVAQGGEVRPVRAPAVVLATGDASGLFPGAGSADPAGRARRVGGDWRRSGDGLAIAHRAGVEVTRPVVVEEDGRRELRAGVPCGRDGATSLPGLFVAGSLGSDRSDPALLARAAIVRSREGAEPLGPYRVQPAIDSPLPPGFAQVKLDRLRAVTGRALAGEIDAARTLAELHRLKGEADEYARARCDLELFSFQNACETAILLFRRS